MVLLCVQMDVMALNVNECCAKHCQQIYIPHTYMMFDDVCQNEVAAHCHNMGTFFPQH